MPKIFKQPVFWLILGIVLYIAVFFYLSFYKYQNYLYNLEDLSIFNNVMSNTANGRLFWFTSFGGYSYLGDHLELGLLLLLPFYYFFQSPLTLLFFQTLFLALSVWPLYLIAKKIIAKPDNSWPALIIALAFLANPFVQNINLEEFHMAALVGFFFLWTFYFYIKNDYRKFFIFFLLTLLMREDAAITLGALSLLIVWEKRKKLWSEKKWWLYPGLISGAYFLFAIKTISFFNPDANFRFLLLYQNINLFSPVFWITKIFSLQNLSVILGFALVSFFLPFFKPKYLFLALPVIIQTAFLDSGNSTVLFSMHYALPVILAVWLSLIDSLNHKKIQNKIKIILFLLILVQFYIGYFFGPLAAIAGQNKKAIANLENNEENKKVLSLIENDKALSGSYRFMPWLSSRETAYHNKLTFLGKKHLSTADFLLPQVDYLLLDAADMIEFYLHFTNRISFSRLYWGGAKNMRETITRLNLQPIYQSDSLILFKKDAALADSEAAAPVSPALGKTSAPNTQLPYEIIATAPLSDEIRNFGQIELITLRKENNVLAMWWRAKEKINDDYFLELEMRDVYGKIIFVKIYPPAYGLLPTHDWPAGQIVKISQILPNIPQAVDWQLRLLKIKGDIELGPLNDTRLIIDKKEIFGSANFK